jgi:hypothetical protein
MYVADTEHGWRLDCDHEILVQALREALRRERSANKTLRREMGLSNEQARRLASDEFRRDANVEASHSDEYGDAQIRCDVTGDSGVLRTLRIPLSPVTNSAEADVPSVELNQRPGTPGLLVVGENRK